MPRTTKVESPPTAADMPLMDLAAVLRQLLRKEAQIDRLELSSPDQEDVQLWRETNLQAVDGVERTIAAMAARALPEAAIQILIASGYAANLAEDVRHPSEKEIVERIARLLRSALPVIGAAAGIDLHAFGAERYGQGAHGWPFCPAPSEQGVDAAARATTTRSPEMDAVADRSEAAEVQDDDADSRRGLGAAALRLVDLAPLDDVPFEEGLDRLPADDDLSSDEHGADAWLELTPDQRLSPVLSQILAEVGLRPDGAA